MAAARVRSDVGAAPGFRICYGMPYATMPPHWHDQVEVNYAVGGSLTYQLAGRTVRIPPGRLSLFWAGTPHAVVGRRGIEDFYWIYVPLVWLLRMRLPGVFMRRLMSGDLLVDADPMQADREILRRWSEELPNADDDRRRLVIKEVEARILRFALGQSPDAEGSHAHPAQGPVEKVVEMTRFLAENYASQIRAADVAAHVGLHPNYAMSLFRRYYGMTLTAYLMRLRVSQAQYLLLSTDHEVSSVAYDTGFGSLSRFYETFREVTGLTPGGFRRASAEGRVEPRSPFNPCALETS